jgi:hypothetical protein
LNRWGDTWGAGCVFVSLTLMLFKQCRVRTGENE